ncbi:tetratricopeptide repeat protein [Prevotella sp.]|uniref:tetratricopeptide repeat protein n=1 Tax=Prevotella sp. TaxID=59823 RepID=UPI00307C72EE
MNKLKLTILFLFMSLAASAQRLAVESLKLRPNDLSARNVNNQRHDLNGKPCALLKVMVLDNITKCSSGNIGDIVTEGPVKLIFITSATPYIELSFQYHYPLTINFADYGYKHLEGNSTYELNLIDAQQMMMGNGGQKIESATETKVEAKTEPNTEVKTESSPSSKDSHRNSIITPAEDIFEQSVEAEKAKDYDKAFKLCKKAAVAGNPRAQYNLAYYFEKGRGCKVDTKKALEWYEKAVVSGYGPAAFTLGYYYEEGNSITVKDAASAYKYYKIGADLGDRDAMSALAGCYRNGIGTSKDINKALDLYLKLSEDDPKGDNAYMVGDFYGCRRYLDYKKNIQRKKRWQMI